MPMMGIDPGKKALFTAYCVDKYRLTDLFNDLIGYSSKSGEMDIEKESKRTKRRRKKRKNGKKLKREGKPNRLK